VAKTITPITDRSLHTEELSSLTLAIDEHAIVSAADAKGVITYVNEAFEAISGYAACELIGKTHSVVQSHEHPKAFYQNIKKTIQCGETWQGIIQNKAKSGSHYWLKSTIKPVIDDDAMITGFIAVQTDVTSDHKYSQALQQLTEVAPNAQIFEHLTSALHKTLELRWVGIGVLHLEANVIELIGLSKNGRAAPLFHYNLNGTPCQQVIEEKKTFCVDRDVIASFPDDSVLIDTHAEYYIGEPLRTTTGEVLGILWGIHDAERSLSPIEINLLQLTARRATIELQRLEHEKTLQRQIRALRALGHANTIISKASKESTLLQDVCHILVSHGEFSVVWIDYIDPGADDGLKTMAKAHAKDFTLINSNEVESIKAIIADKSAETKAILSNKSVVELKTIQAITQVNNDQTYAYSVIALPLIIQGATLGVLTLVERTQDPLQKEDLRPLKHLAGNLTFGILHIRTLEDKQAVEKQLRQSHRMETIGQLTTGIAHDFNNILASILGYADLAEGRAKDDPKLLKYLGNVTKAGNRARDLVMQMLAFSKAKDDLETGHTAIYPETFIKEIVEMLRATFPKSITLSVEIDTFGTQVVIKPTELQQIVVNLAINARDAIGNRGRCTIRLYEKAILQPALCQSCHQQFKGQFLVIEVQDDGSGIDADTLPHIFDSFFSTKHDDKGTGLGLFNVHGIAHTRTGHIEVTSEPGQGSRFRVLLPVAKKALKKRAAVSGDKKPASKTRHDRIRIMVVDDEASSAGFLQEWLRGLEFDVTAFTDSLAARKHLIIDRHEYDVIIADYQMPGLLGSDLLSEYIGKYQEKTAILLGSKNDRNVLENSDANIHFVEKPLNTASLRELLDDILHT
jgi:PAS domain S-box-containing protein